jgi:hypothetical protein
MGHSSRDYLVERDIELSTAAIMGDNFQTLGLCAFQGINWRAQCRLHEHLASN